jgi:hypothetical protein
MRRFTRLTNAFSKKTEKLAHWPAYFICYNFCRVRQTLGVTPGMEAGVTDRARTIEEDMTPMLINSLPLMSQ